MRIILRNHHRARRLRHPSIVSDHSQDDAQGKLTDELRLGILAAETSKRVEDLFLLSAEKRTPASDALREGPGRTFLGDLVQGSGGCQPARSSCGYDHPEKGYLNNLDDVLIGVKLILTVMSRRTYPVRSLWESGGIVSRKAEPKVQPPPPPPPSPEPAAPVPVPEASAPVSTEETPPTPPAEATPSAETPPTGGDAPASPPAASSPPPRPPRPRRENRHDEKKSEEYRDYFDFAEGLRAIPPHRILALNRGEKEHVLRVRLDWDVNHIRGPPGPS